MTPAKILAQIQTQLRNSSDLSYVDDTHIFIGMRDNITSYPVIVIETNGDRKVSDMYPDENIIQKVSISAGVRVSDAALQLIGSTTIKGMLDLKNDIKKALSADHTLNGECINMTITDSIDDNGEDYPLRGFLMNVEVLYRQNILTRT